MLQSRNKVLVVGASGVIGQAALRHFSRLPDWDAVGVARRPPVDVHGAEILALDLTDRSACEAALGQRSDITHVVYAAVYEKPGGLVGGWSDREQMQTNLAMLKNVVEPLEGAGGNLQHIMMMQGGKAYGIHLDPHIRVPAKERWPRHPHENFYWLQEDFLRERQPRKSWHFTILRPRVVFGDALGSNMNPIPAIGVYACLRKEAGLPLAFPGGPERIYQATDSDLIARACAWAATAVTARNEIFNLEMGMSSSGRTCGLPLPNHWAWKWGRPNPYHWRRPCPAGSRNGRPWCANTGSRRQSAWMPLWARALRTRISSLAMAPPGRSRRCW